MMMHHITLTSGSSIYLEKVISFLRQLRKEVEQLLYPLDA
jgi:hypothetical protein